MRDGNVKKPLAVGDRVRLIGYSESGADVDCLKGTVEALHNTARVRLDNMLSLHVKPSQCRRLKPKVKKEPREIWAIIHTARDGWYVDAAFVVPGLAEAKCDYRAGQVVARFVESPEKGKGEA